MKKLKIFEVDAFTNKLFGGNQAAVCPLDEWVDDDLMQHIAAENNFSETAFFVKHWDVFEIRWFTPRVEIDLAGHPTLATAHVIFNHLNYNKEVIRFGTRKSGELTVSRKGELYAMNFPSRPGKITERPNDLLAALGGHPLEVVKSRDYLVIFNSEEEVKSINPDLNKLKNLAEHGVIVSAPGTNSDFVSRFFAPAMGINEDPVTGSAHCTLIPYWAEKLNKKELHAFQVSERRGELFCTYLNDRVEIAGAAVTYLEGEISVS